MMIDRIVDWLAAPICVGDIIVAVCLGIAVWGVICSLRLAFWERK